MDILRAIGTSSIVRLRKVVPPACAEILVKLEWENPTGSMKDRMAQAVISRAEADGRLKPGDTVVEYTGGSTGASLALVCAAKGYRIRIVSSDAFSQEKLDQMAALGAELTLVQSEGGRTTKKLILDMIDRPLRGHGRFFTWSRHRAQAIQAERQDRRGRTRRILGVARGSGRASQDRGRRDRLHTAALGTGSGG
jgi:cysteine synthase